MISATGNGTKTVFAVLMLFLVLPLYSATSLQKYTISKILFKTHLQRPIDDRKAAKYLLLLDQQPGEIFNYRKNRKSMENLYKTGLFSNVETEVDIGDEKKNNLDLYFILTPQYTITDIEIESNNIKKRDLIKSIFSLRLHTPFDEKNLAAGVREVRDFMNSRGYFNPDIQYRVVKREKRAAAEIHFTISSGRMTRVNKIRLTVPNDFIYYRLKKTFVQKRYIPYRFNKSIEKARKILRKLKYYFPEIKIEEQFLDGTKTAVDLNIVVKPGYRYEFKFEGISDKIDLIGSIWDKKVFEKWAEQESKAKILFNLKEKGYLSAEIESSIRVKGHVKHITFKVNKKKKYLLGDISFEGNNGIGDDELMKMITADDQLYEKLFGVRSSTLRVDQEVVRIYYYFKGYPSCVVAMEPTYHEKRVDIRFRIIEGTRYTVDSILFGGNHGFNSALLYRIMKSRINGPFVQRVVNEDVERIRNFYYARGYDSVEINPEVSQGNQKSILINIDEGSQYKMGNLVIIGASGPQEGLLRARFPMRAGSSFNRVRVDIFKQEIEDSAIFNQITVSKISKPGNIIDVLIQAVPDYSKYYGFGVGWEQPEEVQDANRKDIFSGFRGTLEYQARNIFNRYSTFSGLIQAGPSERRLVISYDTPYFLRKPINSELKITLDSEIYPSYEFERIGVSESIVRKIGANSYMLASLSWYRTQLTQLEILPTDLDRLKDPFDTTALRFSYVREKRDDPFNPTSGMFFSSDLKVGLPIFGNRSFVKFRWSFQKNFKLLRRGVFTFSFRNGLATGDMSITERFFAGGPNTFRGVRTDWLGPTAPGEGGSQKPGGGNALILANLETIFPVPLIPGDSLYYALFADVGNVFEEVGDININRMETAIGFGLRFKTQLGPLRLDFAWHLGPLEGKNFRINLGIGNVF